MTSQAQAHQSYAETFRPSSVSITATQAFKPATSFSSTAPLSQTARSFSTTSTSYLPPASMISAAGEELVHFETTRTTRLRPVVFQPNGNFKALKENGKLTCESHEETLYRGRTKNPLANTVHQLPGYTGFVRGAQHISGRTYGETTRRALTTEYKDIVCNHSVPSVPQQNRRIPQVTIPDSFAHHMFGSRTYHVPGYTGFVPGVRATYAQSYGSSTEQELKKTSELHPRDRSGERDGFAKTAYPKQKYKLDSAPLPGGAIADSPPDMYIPAHVRYLKYFPM